MAIQMPVSIGGPVQAIKPLPGGIDAAPVPIAITSNTSTAGAASQALYVMSTVLCHIRFDGVAATVNDAPLPANTPMVFSVNTGDRVSVIRNSVDGSLYVHDVEAL